MQIPDIPSLINPPVIDWAILIGNLRMISLYLYNAFASFGYWFTAPISEVLSSPDSPFAILAHSNLWLQFVNFVDALERGFNLASRNFYSDLVSSWLGVDSVLDVSFVLVIAGNIFLFVVFRFLKWIWDILPIL